ncbi:hypothetical protein GCM10022245_00650 [Streptomyces mayteni]
MAMSVSIRGSGLPNVPPWSASSCTVKEPCERRAPHVGRAAPGLSSLDARGEPNTADRLATHRLVDASSMLGVSS